MNKIRTSRLLLGVCFAAFCTLTAAQVQPVAISPQPGFVKDGIQQVTLDFDPVYSNIRFGDHALDYYDPSESVDKTHIICFSGDEIEQSRGMYSASIEGSRVTFTTSVPWTTPGKYYLRLPEGALIFTTESGETLKNPFVQYNWYVDDFENPVMTPASGDLTDLSAVQYTLPEGYSFSTVYQQSMFMPAIFICDANGNKASNTPVARYSAVEKDDPSSPSMITYSVPKTTTYPSTEFIPENGQYYLVSLIHNAVSIKNNTTGNVCYIPQDISQIYRYREIVREMFEYTLTPADGTQMDLDAFNDITISVPEDKYEAITPNLDAIEDNGLTAYLIQGDKKIALAPKASDTYYSYLLSPAEQLSEGKWSLLIPQQYFFAEVEDTQGNVTRIYNDEEITAEYSLIQVEQLPKLIDHISLSVPSEAECNRDNTTSQFGTGFGVVAYRLDTPEILVNTSADLDIQLFYEDRLIATANVKDRGEDTTPQVVIQNIALLDDELIDFGSINTLYILFSTQQDDRLHATGRYRVVIPDGAFTLKGKKMQGCSFEYNYTDVATPIDFSYTLTPDPATPLENGTESLHKIRITFLNSRSLDYADRGGATLKDPEGKNIYIGYANTDMKSYLEYPVGIINTSWDKLGDGDYTFHIQKGMINLNSQYWDCTPGTGNFEGLTAIYHVSGTVTSVTLMGVEAADSYNIYDLSGKAVMLQGTPAEISTLPEGIYIINGKKTYLRH